MRSIAKVVVRFFVQSKREGRGKDENAPFLKHPRHLEDQLLRVRSVFEDLNAEHRVKGAIVERQAKPVVEIVRTRPAEMRGGSEENGLILNADIFIDMGP